MYNMGSKYLITCVHFTCLILLLFNGASGLYSLNEKMTWMNASKECTLATLELSFNGTTLDLTSDARDTLKNYSLPNNKPFWIGYVLTFNDFLYIGCKETSNFSAWTRRYKVDGGFELCNAKCTGSNYIAITSTNASENCLCYDGHSSIGSGAQSDGCQNVCGYDNFVPCGNSRGDMFSVYTKANLSNIRTSNGTERQLCLNLNTPHAHEFLWKSCTDWHLGSCELNVYVSGVATTHEENAKWMNATSYCFKNNTTPASPQNIINKTFADNQAQLWTGVARFKVSQTFMAVTPTQGETLGLYVKVHQNDPVTLQLENVNSEYKSLCMQDLTISTSKSPAASHSTPWPPPDETSKSTTTLGKTSSTGLTSNTIGGSTNTQEHSQGGSPDPGIIAAGVVVPILIVIAVVGVLFYLRRRGILCRSKGDETNDNRELKRTISSPAYLLTTNKDIQRHQSKGTVKETRHSYLDLERHNAIDNHQFVVSGNNNDKYLETDTYNEIDDNADYAEIDREGDNDDDYNTVGEHVMKSRGRKYSENVYNKVDLPTPDDYDHIGKGPFRKPLCSESEYDITDEQKSNTSTNTNESNYNHVNETQFNTNAADPDYDTSGDVRPDDKADASDASPYNHLNEMPFKRSLGDATHTKTQSGNGHNGYDSTAGIVRALISGSGSVDNDADYDHVNMKQK